MQTDDVHLQLPAVSGQVGMFSVSNGVVKFVVLFNVNTFHIVPICLSQILGGLRVTQFS